MKPNSIIKKIRFLKVQRREKEFWDAQMRNVKSLAEKREAGLMLLPQSASGGRCFRLGFLWSNQRCTCELAHEARLNRLQAVLLPAVVGASLLARSQCSLVFFKSLHCWQVGFRPRNKESEGAALPASAPPLPIRRSRKWSSRGQNLRGKCRRFARNHGDDSNYTFYLWKAAARSPTPVFNTQKRQRNNRGQQ